MAFESRADALRRMATTIWRRPVPEAEAAQIAEKMLEIAEKMDDAETLLRRVLDVPDSPYVREAVRVYLVEAGWIPPLDASQ